MMSLILMSLLGGFLGFRAGSAYGQWTMHREWLAALREDGFLVLRKGPVARFPRRSLFLRGQGRCLPRFGSGKSPSGHRWKGGVS